MKRITKYFSLILSGLLLFSCKVGLGPAVDTKAPEISITSPETNQSVRGTMTIIGSATDNLELNEVLIDIEENRADGFVKNLKLANLEWFEKSGEDWIPYAGTTPTGDKKRVDFEVDVDISMATSGSEYTITTLVTDVAKNDSRKSKDIRTVIVDFVEPAVSVSSPTLLNYESAAAKAAKYNLKDNTILNVLMNGKFSITGTQIEDTKCDYVYVYLDTNKTTDITMYTDQDGTMNFASRSDDTEYLAYNKITDKNQRNWETTFDVKTFPAKYQSGKHLVRVVTEAHDFANNVETKVQGWFTLYNDADKPWIVADFGSKTSADAETVYPSCQLQGQAYDDDGLKLIKIDIFKNIDGTWTRLEDKSFEIDLTSRDYPTYYAWSVTSLADNCTFFVKATCTDINDIESEAEIRYMGVQDTNPPSLYINQSDNGDSIPLTGNGDFYINGYVSDDGEIADLRIVRIADGKEATEVKYFDKDYKEWNKATSTGFTDENGNKIWTITMDPETVNNKVHKREFSQKFNIYTDFGIDGTNQKLSTQKFIVKAKDKGDSSTAELVAYGGDTEKPSVTIDSISINGGTPRSLDTTITLEPFKTGDYVVLSGTWKDNTDVLKASNLSLSWEKVSDFGVTITYDDASKTKGKWTTKKITPPNATTAVIYAEIKDWGDNLGKTNASFYVSSSLPEFVRISADTTDGSYKDGKEILLYMEFNKKVTFTGGTPSLTLNTGKTATYKEGNGTSKHVFSYTVVNGDNTDQLKVTALNKTGVTWYDTEVTTSKIADASMKLPTGNNTLEANRTIVIDTTAPTLSRLSAITSAGYYGLNSEIFISAEFNETVNFENLNSLTLTLNTGNNVKTTSVSKSGPNTLLFKYKVGEGHQATPLSITAINYGTCKVTDVAGNELTNKTISPVTTTINVDTIAPDTPVISGPANNSVIYADDGTSFTITYKEATGTKKYSLDGGKSWADYTGTVYLRNKGTYEIKAYQEDLAGNQSAETSTLKLTVDNGKVITSLTANKPDGTYKAGQKIMICVTYRKPVVVTADSSIAGSPYLTLNTTPARKAVYSSGSGTKKVYFEYTIQDGDTCSAQPLNVTSFSGVIKDTEGTNIAEYTSISSVTAPNRFIDNREIYVITQKPAVTAVDFAGTESNRTLQITFSANVNKNAGNIVIEQSETGYKVPVVLTESEYTNYSDAIKAYYEEGTNGSSASGAPDLTKKYVLKFTYDSDNATLKGLLKTAGALTVSVPVYSNNVTISGNVMTISLSGSYKLPVKGASYKITVPANLINDDILQTNIASEYTRTLAGVEKPIIRVNKQHETISGTTITQPLTAQVKMDCQTPGASIYYNNSSKTCTQNQLTTKADYSSIKYPDNGLPSVPTEPTADSTAYSAAFTIGSSTTTDYNKGYKIFLRARAKSGSSWSENTYELAYRTVIVFDQSAGTNNYMWIRGGDKSSGAVSTPNFPFNWTSTDYDKVRAMTKYSGNLWYWVSWNLNVPCYFAFLRGNMPSDAATKGPSTWTWGSCNWVGLKDNYPVYPGQSLYLKNVGNNPWGSGDFGFQDKHTETR